MTNVTLVFVTTTQTSKEHSSQSLWQSYGQIEDLSIIPCSLRRLCQSKNESNIPSDVTEHPTMNKVKLSLCVTKYHTEYTYILGQKTSFMEGLLGNI